MKLPSLIVAALMLVLLSACAPIQPVSDMPVVSDPPPQDHDSHDHGTAEMVHVGEAHMPVSCTAEAQETFDHGLALLHSFEYGAARNAFNRTLELDESCVMAYWGVAMSLVEPLWGQPTEERLRDGWAALEQAQSIGAKTPQEQAYLDALTIFYQDSGTVDHATRALAYEAAMAQLVEAYPDDSEAKIFYALALLATASPTDKTYANQQQASAILEPIFVEQPNHPGVAHYLVHSYDYPSLAFSGLNAAQRLAAIAPDAPHTLHMPSHIFTRMGYWQESIDTNQAGADAARSMLPESDENLSSDPLLHAMDYMMYGHLQLAQDDMAKAMVDEINAIDRVMTDEFGAAYALAAIPARYVLERGQWAEATALTLHPDSFGWDLFPQAEAIVVFARGLGAARAGDVEAARQELAQLQTLHETLTANGPAYWAGQVQIQRREIEAWIALAEGRNDEALALMREAAELEAATEKHPVTPGPLAPARELLGEMLLVLEQPTEALVEFEAALTTEPNRFRSLYGAARAAELAGEAEIASQYYETLLKLGEGSEDQRAELAEAAAFMAQ